ncbi:MFS transporter [Chloroflexota bacterium]
MVKEKKIPKIFFGWWTVLAGGITGLWGAGYIVYGFSALFKPISSELGFSRAAASVPSSISRLEGGFEAPLIGWATDKFGPRWLLVFGVFLFGLGLILMRYIGSLWTFYVVWGVLMGTGFNIASSMPINAAIANWFVKKRGLATGIKRVLDGLSGVIVLPLVAWLIITQGWRMTCFIGGLVTLVVILPIVLFGVKQRRPEHYGLLPDGAKITGEAAKDTSHMMDIGVKYASSVNELEFSLKQALRTPAFWMLILATASHNLAAPAINIHAIPFLTDTGIDPLGAASIMAIMVIVSIPFRFIGGIVADRVDKKQLRFILTVCYFLQAFGFGVFLLYQTTAMIYVWFVLYGVGLGMGSTLNSLIIARYYGRKAFGSIYGILQLLITPVGVLAPVYAGWSFDTTGSYNTAFSLVAILLAISAALMFFVRPPKPPARVTDTRQI